MSRPRPHPFEYRRRLTRVVHVGDVAIGGSHPIRVQSMTTPATTDTRATVEQIRRLVEAGCEMVRLTVPRSADAENLPQIRRELMRAGVRVPLIADIHFTPAAAMLAVEHVEKVRINPGNYADKKRFAVREYTDAEYAAELERIEQAVLPLVRRCKELGRAMRIGTNHGSLSDRIMNRYGDSPEGMVESALEFVRICETHGLRDLVLSMKASNPVVVLQAYRLLDRRMLDEGMDYPVHLGVTEAGAGEDGRIKSAIGIGALLDEGIGDTVRVSLTEDPVAEIPVALALVAPYNARNRARREPGNAVVVATGATAPGTGAGEEPTASRRATTLRIAAVGPAKGERGASTVTSRGPGYERRRSAVVRIGPHEVGGRAPVLVEVPLTSPASDLAGLRHELATVAGAEAPVDARAELASVGVASAADVEGVAALRSASDSAAPGVALSARVLRSPGEGLAGDGARRLCAVVDRVHLRVGAPPSDDELAWLAHWESSVKAGAAALLVEVGSPSRPGGPAAADGGTPGGAPRLADEPRDDVPDDDAAFGPGSVARAIDVAVELAGRSAADGRLLLALDPELSASPMLAMRRLVARLAAEGRDTPLVLLDRPTARGVSPLLATSSALGGLLCEGIGDAIHIETNAAADARRLAFGILQAARVRMTRTEFISCPSCGRTLFDLESTTARIQERTAHLKGVKIAVMGCVVNGPGEMADADFGYVGWGENKIALFVGQDMVEKNIPTTQAVERLVDLIKQHDRWVDP